MCSANFIICINWLSIVINILILKKFIQTIHFTLGRDADNRDLLFS